MCTDHAGFRIVGAQPRPVRIIVVLALLSCACLMQGQRNGEHGRRPLICIHDCSNPGDAAPDDDLKDFNQMMALQGTSEQSAALVSLGHELQFTKEQLQILRPISGNIPASQKISGPLALADQSVAKLHTEIQEFLGSFSPAQKSGLKEISKKVEEADSELAKQLAGLDQVAKYSNTAYQQVGESAASVDKTLANIEEDQLALARDMGIILPSTELTINFATTNSVNIGATSIVIPVSADISRISAVNGVNVFAAKIVADMSDLQDNIAELLRPQIEQSPACGEHIELQEAMLIPEAPASRIFTRLHVERWICPSGGRWGATEVATGEGSVELRLVPLIEKDGKLALTAQISHVDGDDFARDSLVGENGHMVPDKITASLVSVVQKAADVKALLPPAVQQSALVNKAAFQHAAGHLALVLDAGLELSDQQTQGFVSEIKQRWSAHQISAAKNTD